MAPPDRIKTRRWIVVAALLLWVACSSLVQRQGWDPAHGPVVPHDTFPADCSLCHVGGDWHTLRADFQFDHERQAGVPLHGAHTDAQCLFCHNDRGPVAAYAARGCAGCHDDPHRGQLGRQCQDCHDERTWRPHEQIARHDRTRFPLVGAHAATACFRCHPGAQVGNFAGASPECQHCHGPDASRSTTVDHQALGLANDCQRCHRPISWLPAAFDHPASFPLSLGHAGRRCNDCHTPGTFLGLSPTCSSCHLDDYQRTTSVPHAQAGFGTDCTQCHSTRAWVPANFDHGARFPLSGGHAGRRCTDCHQGGTWQGLAVQCSSCHLDDYQRVTNPNHQGLGFPQACEQCHSTTSWRGASFNHQFPISGPHRLSCAECHRDPQNARAYSCTHCHDHSQTRMADKHRGVQGYSWASTACYQCHPRGRH